MAEIQGLTGRQLLEEVYSSLKNKGREIKLPSKPVSEMKETFSKSQRIFKFHIVYDSVVLLKKITKIWDEQWAIAFGNLYDEDNQCCGCGIAAEEFGFTVKESDEFISKYIHHDFELETRSRRLLLSAFDGEGTLWAGGPGKDLLEQMDKNPEVYDLAENEYPDPDAYFKTETVDFLFAGILKVLAIQ